MVGIGVGARGPRPGRRPSGLVGRDRRGPPARASWPDRLAPASGPCHALVILPASADGRDLAPRLAAGWAGPWWTQAVERRLRPAPRRRRPGTGSGHGVPARRPGAAAGGGRRAGGGHPGARFSRAVARPDPEVTAVRRAPRRHPGPRRSPPAGHRSRLDPRSSPPRAGPPHHGPGRRHPGGGRAGRDWPRAADDRRAVRGLRPAGAGGRGLGGSAGATRVATDAGWTGYERQIGTTGVTIDPDLYIALGVSGAAQHIGGLGSPGTS